MAGGSLLMRATQASGNGTRAVPGAVYLCQVNSAVSCGACCGLYNVADPGRENLAAMLAYRTDRFEKTHRTVDDILAFKDHIRGRENPNRPFPKFHHCPYIGLIGKGRSRVGCLLHPLADGNGGIDFRGLSYYGGMACRIYFCPTYGKVPPAYLRLIAAAATDWYDYGLMVTEWRLINAFFLAIEKRLGRSLADIQMTANPPRLTPIGDFLRLKTTWPFRSAGSPGPANYFFKDRLYPRPAIDYAAIARPVSPYDTFLVALVSDIDSQQTLAAAENTIETLLRRSTDILLTNSSKT